MQLSEVSGICRGSLIIFEGRTYVVIGGREHGVRDAQEATQYDGYSTFRGFAAFIPVDEVTAVFPGNVFSKATTPNLQLGKLTRTHERK